MVGRSIQTNITNVGTKSVEVRLAVKTPDGKTLTLKKSMVAKGKGFVGPVIRFSKSGTYTFTLFIGSTKKLVTVKVSK